LEEVVEEYDFDEGGAFVVGKSYGCGNVFSSRESIHAVFEIDVLVRDVFRGNRAAGRRCGRSMRHIVNSFYWINHSLRNWVVQSSTFCMKVSKKVFLFE
jgi:hypothetical protein